MDLVRSIARPVARWRTPLHQWANVQTVSSQQRRSMQHNPVATAEKFGLEYLDPILRASVSRTKNPTLKHPKRTHPDISIYPAPASSQKFCTEPIKAFNTAQVASLDPTGARARLFSRANPEAAKVGDILMVRQASGEPFSGVCMNIRRRGQDTGILLRNQLTRVGVEMWFKVFSPGVKGIEIVQRREKRARRARLYYLRKPKHDIGSVENIVRQYLRQRALLGAKGARGRDANANKKK